MPLTLVMVLLPGKGPLPSVVPREPMYSHSDAQISWKLWPSVVVGFLSG